MRTTILIQVFRTFAWVASYLREVLPMTPSTVSSIFYFQELPYGRMFFLRLLKLKSSPRISTVFLGWRSSQQVWSLFPSLDVRWTPVSLSFCRWLLSPQVGSKCRWSVVSTRSPSFSRRCCTPACTQARASKALWPHSAQGSGLRPRAAFWPPWFRSRLFETWLL